MTLTLSPVWIGAPLLTKKTSLPETFLVMTRKRSTKLRKWELLCLVRVAPLWELINAKRVPRADTQLARLAPTANLRPQGSCPP